jgi:cardiolipin synthase
VPDPASSDADSSASSDADSSASSDADSSASSDADSSASSDAGGARPDRVLTVPNALTAFRLACLPVFGLLLAKPGGGGRRAAAYLLAALGISDGLDGYIARRFNQVSSRGAAADPLVDRALVLSATGGALAIGAVPPWFVGVVLAREVVVAGGGAALALTGAGRLEVSRAGKAGAFGMMVALPLFILGASSSRRGRQARAMAWVAAGCGQGFAWGAAAGYVPQALAALSERRQGLHPKEGGP